MYCDSTEKEDVERREGSYERNLGQEEVFSIKQSNQKQTTENQSVGQEDNSKEGNDVLWEIR